MNNQKFLYRFILISFCILASVAGASAQEEKDDPPASRSITSLDFQKQRPTTVKTGGAKFKQPVKNEKRRANIAKLTSPKRKYTRVSNAAKRNTAQTKKPKPQAKSAPLVVEQLGVTFWRLRPPRDEEREDAPTFPINTGDGQEFWTAERVNSTTRFKIGDRVRFTIESPRRGFLYIVNREFYIDGTKGEAKMIFPTRKTRGGGENEVFVGDTVDVPNGSGNFRIAPDRDDYAGEEVIVIISPKRLTAVKLASSALPVTDKELGKWIADWGGTTDIYDAEDGEGIAITRTENEAVNTRALVQEEPSPQTIFKTRARKTEPLLITFQLQAKTPNK